MGQSGSRGFFGRFVHDLSAMHNVEPVSGKVHAHLNSSDIATASVGDPKRRLKALKARTQKKARAAKQAHMRRANEDLLRLTGLDSPDR